MQCDASLRGKQASSHHLQDVHLWMPWQGRLRKPKAHLGLPSTRTCILASLQKVVEIASVLALRGSAGRNGQEPLPRRYRMDRTWKWTEACPPSENSLLLDHISPTLELGDPMSSGKLSKVPRVSKVCRSPLLFRAFSGVSVLLWIPPKANVDRPWELT